jgi:Family of unknown function (DUF6603)
MSVNVILGLKATVLGIKMDASGELDPGGVIKELGGSVTINKSLRDFLRSLKGGGYNSEIEKSDIEKFIPLDIRLNQLSFSYRNADPRFMQFAASFSGGGTSIDFLLGKTLGANTEGGFVVGLVANTHIGLSDFPPAKLPLFSDLLNALSINQVRILYASRNFETLDLPTEIRPEGRAPNGSGQAASPPPTPGTPIGKGLSLAALIGSGDYQKDIVLQITGRQTAKPAGTFSPATAASWKEKEPPAPVKKDSAAAAAGKEDEPSSGIRKWFSVQKTLGPLHVQRIGGEWRDGKLGLLLDTSVDLLGLTLGLLGFRVSLPLSDFISDPKPSKLEIGLDGLAVGFKGGPVQISGALLKVPDLPAGVSLQYDGSLLVKAEVFTLAAMGSYAVIQKKPSLFVFAVLAQELGGPAFFFVTGLAFGFGFNRLLKLPPIEDVKNFPLIKGAMDPGYFGGSSDPRAAMDKMQAYIVPSVGDYWLAAGVKFNSYGMINSFALITVSFGVNFQFALLGLSRMTVPVQIPGAPAVDPVACAELALKVTFTLTTGVLAVEARLTDNSFIFSRSCRLTGGFAFYCWFGPEHEGDFVVSLGGYHPRFVPPPHYPLVPRLGMNWSISSHLSITGEIYFALTPSCLMAGGKLNAVFQAGNLRAWFYAYADFLISWKPFYYDIAIGVSIGVSYRITFLGINKTLSIELGASVHLWGPPFGGIAHVSWFIISFDISFGTRKITVPPPIGWDEFHKSFLPQQQNSKELESVPDPVVGVIRITGGLIQEQEKKKGNGQKATLKVVTAHEFSFTTESLIPSTDVRLNGKNVGSAQTGQTAVLGIRPMGKSSLRSEHVVAVEKKRALAAGWDDYLDPSLAQKSVPYALWSNDLSRPDRPSAKKIDNVPSGMRVSLRNREPSHGLESIALEKFAYEDIDKRIDWQEFEIPPTIPAPGENTFMNTVWDNPVVDAKRNAILQVLGRQGLQLQKIEVPDLAAKAGEIFQSEPDMAVLGEAFKKSLD